MQVVVQKWGNSLGFRIPSLWAKDNNVKNGSKIEVLAEKGKIVILPQRNIHKISLHYTIHWKKIHLCPYIFL